MEQKQIRIVRDSIVLILLLLININAAVCQKLTLLESEIDFFSEAPLENIEALNTKSSGLFDTQSGQMALIIPISEFLFPNSLMQEHFNEKYLESDKYPRAIFKGTLIDFDPNLNEQILDSKGSISIHGVENEYSTKGKVTRKGDVYEMESTFTIILKDHKIKIPKLMWQNISEEVKINVKLVFGKDE